MLYCIESAIHSAYSERQTLLWEVVEQTNINKTQCVISRAKGAALFTYCQVTQGGGMGQSIVSDDMSLEEKLKAIAEAIGALDGGNKELICEGCK